jgi:CheY-like chemotaxis protein
MVLLAEDDEDDQELITLAFNKATSKHRLHIANNGQEALEYLSNLSAQHLPCLIVLDLNMPVLNGVQTLEALTKNDRYQDIPKVIFTTSDSSDDRAKCLAIGANDYVVKPHNMKEIVNTIANLLQYCR